MRRHRRNGALRELRLPEARSARQFLGAWLPPFPETCALCSPPGPAGQRQGRYPPAGMENRGVQGGFFRQSIQSTSIIQHPFSP